MSSFFRWQAKNLWETTVPSSFFSIWLLSWITVTAAKSLACHDRGGFPINSITDVMNVTADTLDLVQKKYYDVYDRNKIST